MQAPPFRKQTPEVQERATCCALRTTLVLRIGDSCAATFAQ